MSWLPDNNGWTHPTYNYQHPNPPDLLNHSSNQHNDLNLFFDPHLNLEPSHFHEFLGYNNSNNSNSNNNNNNNGACLDLSDVPEVPDTCFNYITELLRDDSPEEQLLGTLQDYMAYQAYYESLTNTLTESNPSPPPPPPPPRPQHSSNKFPSLPSPSLSENCNSQAISTTIFGGSSHGSNSLGATYDFCGESDTSSLTNPCLLQSSLAQFPLLQQALLPTQIAHPSTSTTTAAPATINLIGRKHLHGQEGDGDEQPRSKHQSTSCPETYDQISEYEEDLFCPEGKYEDPSACHQSAEDKNSEKNKKKKKQGGGGSRRRKSDVVDLMALLINCAESVSRMDIGTARDQIKLIRQHSSPYGDSIQRVAHYLVNGLDQRLSGIRYKREITANEFLKASRIYVGAAPFQIMSYYVSNKTICNLATNAKAESIHIIDFGIAYGLQWPCIIYNLSKVEPTPPKLRITGIDFPESGFQPAQRLEETGRCLRKYSERFNLQFEYKAIVAESWGNVSLEEIEIRREEFTLVNSLYRSQQLCDESVEAESSPRDAFLEAVRRIRPAFFVHGVVNGNLNAPFFVMRFKEAVAHYTALFEVCEATMPKEEVVLGERGALEGAVFGEMLRNIVACEGRERVERPETYRRWQARMARAGFGQVPLERDLMRRAKAMVKRSFRKDFLMEEDCGWAVQGWKGRILYAVSCWMPQH